MIGRSPGSVARGTRAAVLFLSAVVLAACGASPPSGPPPTPAASSKASALETPTDAASPPTVTASLGIPTGLGVPAGKMVDIGGRSLYVSCVGESAPGEPTVVFENGLGSPRSSWSAIQTAVSGTVRACAYDRAGIGPSDRAATYPRTAQDLADDLATLLDRAGIQAPYVFVSHSIGPWVTTLFTVAHPEAVAGLVFVDPRGPDVTDEWVAALPPPTPGESEALTGLRGYIAGILADPPDNPEGLEITASEAEVRAALGKNSPPFGDTPLVVLQARLTPDAWADPSEPVGAAWASAWFAGQSALASASTAGRVVVLAKSGHNVQEDAPTAVIDAIHEVLDRP
jgi:pimeloyl-ACP methyl ester carboxylesterase